MPRSGRSHSRGRLLTTPGQFDYPPASSAATQMNPPVDGRNPTLPRPSRPRRPSSGDTNNRHDANPPWIPSSPEARARMQRVLRQVHEMQENDNLRAHVERLRENQRRLRDNDRRINEVEGRMRDFDNLPSSSSSRGVHTSQRHILPGHTRTPLAQEHTMPDLDMPVRGALREASERLRLVNDELRDLLDRPIEGPAGQIQQLADAQYHVRRFLGSPEATAEGSPAAIPSLQTPDELVPRSIHFQDPPRHRDNARETMAQLRPMYSLNGPPLDPQANVRSPSHLTNRNAQIRNFGQRGGPGEALTSLDAWRSSNDRRHTESSLVTETAPRLGLDDEDAGCPRRKRRRLDDGPTPDCLPLIQYGYEGQVVPGKLKLQLISCDGGIVEPPMADFMTTTYRAENVLKDDASVYCTKSQRCNMIFQHQHQTTFCLERLVIKAPKTGFADPVQEGLVFVSLRNDEVFDRTARYQIYYFPTSRFASYFASATDSEPGPDLEIEHPVEHPVDHPVLQPALAPTRSSEGIQNDSLLHPPANHTYTADPAGNVLRYDSDSCSDASSDDEEPQYSGYALSRMRDRYSQRTALPAQRTNAQNILAQRVFDNYHSRGAAARQRRQGRHLHSSPQCSNFDQNSDFLKPAARFSMHPKLESDSPAYGTDSYTPCENSDTMTIKFDPPVSGKFILLKMWSPRHGGNIDVQSIIAYGFAGPRWFPSNEKR